MRSESAFARARLAPLTARVRRWARRSEVRWAAWCVSGLLCLASCSSNGDDDDDSSDGGASGEAGAQASGATGGSTGGKGGGTGSGGKTGGSGGSSSGSGGSSGETTDVAGAAGDDGALGSDEAVALIDDAEGGVLHAGYAELIVPPGALSEPTELTLRRLASDVNVLDDVYELLPSGLEFLLPARFVLDVGEELAGSDPELERRVLSYVDGERAIPLPSRASFRSAGVYVGAVRHFSEVSAALPGESAPSSDFAGFGQAIPYAVQGACTELDKNFLSPEKKGGQPSAAETTVECAITEVEYQAAPREKGKFCISATIPAAARAPEAIVYYPTWENPKEECQAAWDDFVQRLAEHERQHRDIGLSGCEAAYNAAADPTPVCAKTEQAAFDGARAKLIRNLSQGMDPTQATQDSIDVGTGHGVTMDCDCECKDKCERMDRKTAMCVPIECAGECDKCVDGECVEDSCDECMPPTKDTCPAGSSWDDGAGTCVMSCGAGETIEGFPCEYQGTSRTVLAAGTFETSSSLTFRASRFEGCSILYEPVEGSVTSLVTADDCTFEPATQPIDAVQTTCTFAINRYVSPHLVADCGSYWDGTLECDEMSAPTTQGGLWLYSLDTPVVPGEPITGAVTAPGEVDVTFSYSPQ